MKLNCKVGNYALEFTPWAPSEGKVFDVFAFDTETTIINDNRPELIPKYVLGTACNGQRGVFITREQAFPFFRAHQDSTVVCHNAVFDLKITQELLGSNFDLYNLVEANRVYDTMILKRLYSLATEGHTAQGSASLADCSKEHLGVDLNKFGQDVLGRHIRTSFQQFLYKPLASIPAAYLRYAAGDALVTWHLFWKLNELVRHLIRTSHNVFGHGGAEWMQKAIDQFGPLTHHIQLRASIVMDAINRTGIGIDLHNKDEKLNSVLAIKESSKANLERIYQARLGQNLVIGGKGSIKSMQAVLDQVHEERPDISLKRTAKGDMWSTAKDNLTDLVAEDEFFHEYAKYKAAEKLASTYLSKMNKTRIYPRFGYLRASGRTNCTGFNLQNLPREDALQSSDSGAVTIRRCFVPADGHVFVDADYSQIELVVLAHVWAHQFRFGTSLCELINSGQDVHQLIASAVLDKRVEDVTKLERNSAKAVSFGRPGGMGANGLQRVAKISYGQELSLEEIQRRIQAYHELSPELDSHLADEVDLGEVLARRLKLTGDGYLPAWGRPLDCVYPWLGWMLLKALHEPCPLKGNGQPYSPTLLDYLWSKAQLLAEDLEPDMAESLATRSPSEELWKAVRNVVGRRPVFTLTGRLRANASFSASRNTLFQGAAADGAILAMWLLWRKGYKIVSFIHDQVVVEVPDDEHAVARKEEIVELMKLGMLQIVPGMNVNVEAYITCSLNKSDRHPNYV